MSREIKFRAWDKKKNRMWTTFQPFGKDYERQVDRFEVMQYTGLKDRAGVEIYEGDIIQDWCGIREVKFQVFDDQQGYDLELDDTDLVVLGNIHEHPNLIK